MRYKITKKQFELISEQSDYMTDRRGNALLNSAGVRSDKDYKEVNKTLDDAQKGQLDPHVLMTVTQIATAFIPFVGPFISAGIGLADAGLYYNEGDTKTAGLVGMFSIIPGIGGLVAKMGLGQVAAKTMGEIGKKIGTGSKLSNAEINIVNKVAKNKALLQSEIDKLGKNVTPGLAKQNVKSQLKKQAIKKGTASVATNLGGYGAAGLAYSKGYDQMQKNTPKAKATEENIDWSFVKSAFGSSGSLEDNKKLNAAWDKGWRPGTVVPVEYQTDLFKKNYEEEQKNLSQLAALIGSE